MTEPVMTEACRICRGAAAKQCGKCRQEYYCGKRHQEQDWPSHKISCRPFTTVYKQGESTSTKSIGKTAPLAPLLNKCALCSEVVKITFKSCQRGHLVCNECNKDLPNCPSCKAAFAMDNPVSLKNLLEALPMPCRHAGNGCKEMVDLHKNACHEQFCGFRPFPDTFKSFPGKQLLVRDLTDFHSRQRERYSHDAKKLLMVYSLQSSVTSSVTCRCLSNLCLFIVPIFVHDTFFLLSLFRDEPAGTFVMVFVAFFVGRPEVDVFIRITFGEENNQSKFTLKASLDAEVDGKLAEGSVANVKCSDIDAFITDRTLNLDYEIFTKPK